MPRFQWRESRVPLGNCEVDDLFNDGIEGFVSFRVEIIDVTDDSAKIVSV